MSHAIDILDNALRGDPGGISFLEQTASIYVLDVATTPGQPKTYGWWDFLNEALNEIELYESEGRHTTTTNLYAQLRILSTITRRIARRSVTSDRCLVGVCLSNASRSNLSSLNNDAITQSLVRNNDELRQRCMGRIATIIFDHSFHQNNAHPLSFSDPIAMESLCAVVSCNAISAGPEAVRHLVSDWIVPSVESLPPLAVVAVMNHIAIESMSKSCPVGTHDMIKTLVQPTFLILGPILIESLPENDQYRTTALALKAVDSWCNAGRIGFVKLKSILSPILEAIANALYSNSNIIIDAVSDLIETLLTHDANEASLSLGMSIVAGSLMSNLHAAQQVTSENESSRIQILSELVSAVGLQRFRFQERQQEGDTDVCRCLTRTAAKVLIESLDLVSNGTLQSSTAGVLDLLFKAVSHPSVYVCSIAVEALSEVTSKDQVLATRLLPHLQQKAIIPIHLEADEGGLHEYMNCRERVLDNGLIACFTGSPLFYLQSCSAAIDEFCKHQANSQQTSFQLEAALYCMIAVSAKASKNKQELCPQLEKMINSLTSSSNLTSIPIVTARTCQFIGKYSKTLCQTTAFVQSSTFVVSLFNERNIAQLATDIDTTDVSPLSEACIALKQLLFYSPQQFSTPEAKQALEDIWLLPYRQHQTKFTRIQDREMLCRGLIAVITAMPNDQWLGSMETLTRPLLTCLGDVIKEADSARSARQDTAPMISRLSIEIGVLAVMIKFFLKANVSKGLSGDEKAKSITCQRDAMVSILHKAWAGLTHVSNHYCVNDEEIATSLSQLLYNSISLCRSEDDLPLLLEITGLIKSTLGVVVKTVNPQALIPVLTVVQRFIELHGSKIESNQNSTASIEPIQAMAKDLMLMSYEGVRDAASQDLVAPMFELLSACAQKALLFLLILSRNSQQAGEVVCASIETALAALTSNETDVALSSILFLRKLVSSMTSTSIDGLNEEQIVDVKLVVDSIRLVIEKDVLSTIVTVSCVGIAQPEVLGPMTSLLEVILTFSQWKDIEASVSSSIDLESFQMGNEAKKVIYQAFQRSTNSKHTSPNFAKMIEEISHMHQTDDNGSIAGGEAVLQFIEKYKSS